MVEQRRGALRTAVVWDAVCALLADRTGLLRPGPVRAVRVFTDLVPSALVDVQPGAEALLALERAVANRPEFVALAAQLQVVAQRD